ncbi:MAG: DUF2513 domain-containing protein [Atopobiaceae bacterium]|nr:DUF2513 domain-containing protein [Atopobiaceae bacterium]
MKRDMDLVRRILTVTEKAESAIDVNDLATDAHSMESVIYHVRMMEHHGLIDATVKFADDGCYVGWVTALTWDGCDYLDAIRDESVWRKTKQVVKETVGSTTLDIIKETAKLVAMTAIKAQLGL